jgi:hypothetical protein
MTSELSAVELDGFRLVPELGKAEFLLKVSGSCDSRTTPLLESFLDRLHTAVVHAQVKRVILVCEDLYFMNSASVKCFVMWLSKVKALPGPSRYHVTVRTNRFLAWHQRSFSAISRSAPEVFTVDT